MGGELHHYLEIHFLKYLKNTYRLRMLTAFASNPIDILQVRRFAPILGENFGLSIEEDTAIDGVHQFIFGNRGQAVEEIIFGAN